MLLCLMAVCLVIISVIFRRMVILLLCVTWWLIGLVVLVRVRVETLDTDWSSLTTCWSCDLAGGRLRDCE